MSTRIVVEWTRKTLRVAVAESSGRRLRLVSVLAQPAAPGGVNAEQLRAALRAAKVQNPQAVGVVPREQVISRVVKFPTTSRQELAQMVALYAKGQLPYPAELAHADFHLLGQGGGFSTVAILACQRETVERVLGVLRGAGARVGLLTVSSWGVLGWYQAVGAPAAGTEPCLVVNVDDARTDLVLIGQGRILSSRSVGQGLSDWPQPGEAAQLLAAEIDRSRAGARNEVAGTEVRSVLLTGLGALESWRETLGTRLNLPVAAKDAAATLKLAAAVPVSPVVVAGLALSAADSLLNLSPQEVRAQSQHRRQVRELSLVGVLVLLTLALGAGVLGARMWHAQRLAGDLDQVLAEVGPKAKRLQEQSRANHTVLLALAERHDVAELLAGVIRRTPPGISFERVTFERSRGELSVRGSAATNQDVLNYLQQLEGLESVRQVRLKHTTRRGGLAGERTEFEVILLRKGPVG